MSVSSVILTLIIWHSAVDGGFNRDIEVYEDVVGEIHRYFRNTNIVFFYANDDLGIREEILLWTLRNTFSKSVSTSVMDFRSFNKTVADSFNNVVNPLFVLLDDNRILRGHLAWVSEWMIMSTYSTWLLFVQESTSIESFFENIYVSIDSTFLISQQLTASSKEQVMCIYHIEISDLQIKQFASWTKKSGLAEFTKVLDEKTKDFGGKIMRVGFSDPEPGNYSLTDKKDVSSILNMFDFYKKIHEIMKNSLNYTVTFKKSSIFGGKENGSWIGLFGMLQKNEVDILATNIAMISVRIEVANYLSSFGMTRFHLVIRRSESTVIQWAAYLAPFSVQTWSSVLLTIIIVSSSIAFTKWAYPRSLRKNRLLNISRKSSGDVVLVVFGSFCNQGIIPSKINAERLMHLIIQFTAVIILASYSAFLISSLAVETVYVPFTTMQGLIDDNTYKIGVEADSVNYGTLKNSKTKVLRTLYEKYLVPDKIRSVKSGLEKVCNDDKFAFITPHRDMRRLFRDLNCTLQPLDVAWTRNVALLVSKKSPFREASNRYLCKLRTSGMIEYFDRDPSFSRYLLQANLKKLTDYDPVSIKDVLPLLMFVMAAGIILSFAILFIENVFFFLSKLTMK